MRSISLHQGLALGAPLFLLACGSTATNASDAAASSAAGASVGSGGSGGFGASGSNTGAGASASGGFGPGGAGPCPEDCSLIEAPQCYQALCNTGRYPGPIHTCIVVPADGAACDDQLFCTVGDTCQSGECLGGAPNTCALDPQECTTTICDEAAQICSTVPLAEGSACVSDDPCSEGGACTAGACVGQPKNCASSPLAACNTVFCNPNSGECEGFADPAKNGNSCVSGAACSVAETCSNGACVGGSIKDCSYLDVGCTSGVCDPADGSCKPELASAGDPCSSAADACNTGICNMGGTCLPVPTNDGQPCSDGSSCTSGETCSAGACTGGSMAGYTQYFSEGFANNNAGWVLGMEWEIGSAAASNGGTLGPDPSADHGPSADNGVAGVLIGDITNGMLHPYFYLTSPAIDLSAAPGAVYLEFWRWLNSDYTPFMENAIEVWNGVAWVTIWVSGPAPPISDTSWTKVVHELTPYKNAALQVRFGYATESAGAYSVSSWNIDDVVIANQSCN